MKFFSSLIWKAGALNKNIWCYLWQDAAGILKMSTGALN